MNNVRTILFAITGFGNNTFAVLKEHPCITLIGVFTPPRQAGSFPYYENKNINDIVRETTIPLYEGLSLKEITTVQLIETLAPDLIIVSGFNQILPSNIIVLAKMGVLNIHPSLLPKYRGSTPTTWVLLNGEKETGVTVHLIEDERIDAGRIITQTKIQIELSDTDGLLRKKLAKLTENTLLDALQVYLTKDKAAFQQQNESEATYYPKRTAKDAQIDPQRPFYEIVRRIRAMTPYPGAYLQHNGKVHQIIDATLIDPKGEQETKKERPNYIILRTAEGLMQFRCA